MKKQIYFRDLSDRDLLSMVCESEPQANDVMKLAENKISLVSRLSVEDLCKVPGIGEAKAKKILAVVEMARRIKNEEIPARDKITCSSDAWKILEQITNMGDLDHEEFWTIYLDRANRVIKVVRISEGGISGTVTDIKIILNHAVRMLASGLIVAHNHPSGTMRPSEADIKISNKLKEAAKLLDLNLLDSMILTNSGYLSFADENYLKP